MKLTRVEIGMRLMVDTDSYERLGRVMDLIETGVRNSLHTAEFNTGAFDFTHFNTHPCKSIEMAHYNDGADTMPEDSEGQELRSRVNYAQPPLPPVE